MALISPSYVLEERKSNWSAEQEKGISTIYPFDLQPSGPDDYVARTYLQFLWLPNSLMSLTYLIPSLRRVEASSASCSKTPHPIHAFLEPLLLTPRLVSNKYHSELVQILANGGGAGEMEEAMMWYAVEHEKKVEADGLPLGPGVQKHGQDGEEGPWTDEKWREQYLNRMERREVQIQILLYMFKLSLTGNHSLLGVDDTSKAMRSGKRKRPSMAVPIEPILTIEDHLEAFMDKLAMWQLMGRIDDAFNLGSAPTKTMDRNVKDERDWTQIFVEDVVEPHFKTPLPALCKLLRTKVFPTSPFSDTESDEAPTRTTSPEPTVAPPSPTTNVPTDVPLKRTLSRTTSTSFSRAPSRAPSLSRYVPSPTRSISTSLPSRNLVRSRSSTLSVSLAQEQEARAVAVAEQTKKRARLHREVSMTRVFKNKGKNKSFGGPDRTGECGNAAVKIEAPKVAKTREDMGVTLVKETPVKSRIQSNSERLKNPFIEPISLDAKRNHSLTAAMLAEDEGQDEEWTMDSSPVVVVFDPVPEKQKDKLDNNDEKSNLAEEDSTVMRTGKSKPSRKRPKKK